MNDLIDRRAALDAFGLSEKTRKYGGDHSGYDTRMLYEIQDTLENLPAVQPDHVADISKKVSISCGHENDMISRQAVIALAKDIYVPTGDGGVYRTRSIDPQEVRELPAVQPDHNADVSKKVDMYDCISRRAAIDALDIAIERYDEIAEKYRKKADIERNDYMDMRDNAYEAQQLAQWLNELKYLREKIEQITIKPEPHWIPCSERLPEEGQKCLVCDKGGIGIDTYIGHGNPYNWKWYTRDYDAWMPLPEPYNGGDSE